MEHPSIDIELEATFLSLIHQGNLVELYKFLRKNNIPPHSIKDNRGYTALHLACYNNSTSIVQFLLRYVSEIYPDDGTLIRNWLNIRTVDGHTPLLLSCFRGNLVKFM